MQIIKVLEQYMHIPMRSTIAQNYILYTADSGHPNMETWRLGVHNHQVVGTEQVVPTYYVRIYLCRTIKYRSLQNVLYYSHSVVFVEYQLYLGLYLRIITVSFSYLYNTYKNHLMRFLFVTTFNLVISVNKQVIILSLIIIQV